MRGPRLRERLCATGLVRSSGGKGRSPRQVKVSELQGHVSWGPVEGRGSMSSSVTPGLCGVISQGIGMTVDQGVQTSGLDCHSRVVATLSQDMYSPCHCPGQPRSINADEPGGPELWEQTPGSWQRAVQGPAAPLPSPLPCFILRSTIEQQDAAGDPEMEPVSWIFWGSPERSQRSFIGEGSGRMEAKIGVMSSEDGGRGLEARKGPACRRSHSQSGLSVDVNLGCWALELTVSYNQRRCWLFLIHPSSPTPLPPPLCSMSWKVTLGTRPYYSGFWLGSANRERVQPSKTCRLPVWPWLVPGDCSSSLIVAWHWPLLLPMAQLLLGAPSPWLSHSPASRHNVPSPAPSLLGVAMAPCGAGPWVSHGPCSAWPTSLSIPLHLDSISCLMYKGHLSLLPGQPRGVGQVNEPILQMRKQRPREVELLTQRDPTPHSSPADSVSLTAHMAGHVHPGNLSALDPALSLCAVGLWAGSCFVVGAVLGTAGHAGASLASTC
ncbi:hypothetical protein Cadr_000027900 [Camelus dromedarius]|uniref:Uncharacterized protein n=1 Tax=Camelus dromedarius TaxID=9838 RepID=A0A5N4C971_CAMDR|nr:hypothetical protein Cadr_000027900 [Camelus dromedarius]